ncbi:MAG TPA: cysteine synthase A [Spirochaetia bacterium]|nr:cysteine synthase A [Spirochaetia bacterium]
MSQALTVAEDLTQLVGRTPLLKLARFQAGQPGSATILLKLELANPGSSVKDRIALAMVEDAEAKGLLKPGATIIEPTSGNTGIGLAWVAAVRGYKIILTMPESMSIERRKLLAALGASLVLTPATEGMTGAVEKAEQLKKNIPGSWIPGQFDNGANPLVHYRTTGPEIWEAAGGKVDALVAGVGTGGTVSGTGKFLKEKNPAVRVVAVEPASSPLISTGQSGPHMIQGIGANFVPSNYNAGIVDEVVTIDQYEAIAAAKELALKEGLLAGISTGANVLAARRLAARPEFAGKTIVTVACDTGERYISTLLFHQD